MIAVRVAAFLAWLVAFAASMGAFVYLIGFVGNRYTFNSIDSGVQLPTAEAAWRDLLLLALFGAQHSLMARRAHRTLYLAATAVVLFVLFFKWEPMPRFVWETAVRWPFETLFWGGWALALWAAASANPLDTFGAKQAWAALLGVQHKPPAFTTAGPYRWGKHPMMLGLLVAFWSTNEMSQGHLLFAAGMTAYVLVGVRRENRYFERFPMQ